MRLGTPTTRELVPFEYVCTAGGAFLCLAMSYGADRATVGDLAVVSISALAFLVRGRTLRVPDELFAVAVIAPIWIVVAQPGAPMEGSFFISVLMVLSVASVTGNRRRAAAIAVVGATYPFIVNRMLDEQDIGWIAWTMAHLFTFVLGLVINQLSSTINELDRTREALAEQAVSEERRRIARELHDLTGHTLAAVMLHVTGARHVLRRDPDEAERALFDAEAVGRRSLDQIRATVAALRTTESGVEAALPTAFDLDSLADEYRRAGLDVAVSIEPSARDLDGPVGVAVHRIVRESLANVARHAPRNRVAISGTVGDDEVVFAVADHGTRPGPANDSPHFGVIGMRERARALGGSLRSGPTQDGWSVEVRLPISPDQDVAVAR